MPVKKDYNTGSEKHYEGPVHGGEGKHNLDKVAPYEYTGVYKSGPNPKLHTETGYTATRDGREEKGFDLHEKGYAGPQNWTPTNLGERHPDSLEHSS
jgi:hypothetical protein